MTVVRVVDAVRRKISMSKLLIISFDAVGDKEFNRLLQYPNFAAMAGRSAIVRKVKSVFLSNTYPVHTSVVTGVEPAVHGLINNTDRLPMHNPRWWYDAKRIKVPTLWDAAANKGLTVATVLWPVTGKSKAIKWNVPESLADHGKSQVANNLRNGSKLLQLKLLLKHGSMIDGIDQPALDNFTTACAKDILTEKNPDLTLVHFTAYDTICHHNGVDSPELDKALEALDNNLGILRKVAGPDCNVIVFSDHAQLPAEKDILPNKMLADIFGLTKETPNGYDMTKCYFECCGGSAFFREYKLADEDIAKVKEETAKLNGFNRFLTKAEMKQSGREGEAFGFCAKVGYTIHNFPTDEKGDHGYPLDYDNYDVFYMGKGPDFKAGEFEEGGSLLDIAPLACEVLGLSMRGIKEPRRELLE